MPERERKFEMIESQLIIFRKERESGDIFGTVSLRGDRWRVIFASGFFDDAVISQALVKVYEGCSLVYSLLACASLNVPSRFPPPPPPESAT